jgi:hypothetical protein
MFHVERSVERSVNEVNRCICNRLVTYFEGLMGLRVKNTHLPLQQSSGLDVNSS